MKSLGYLCVGDDDTLKLTLHQKGGGEGGVM